MKIKKMFTLKTQAEVVALAGTDYTDPTPRWAGWYTRCQRKGLGVCGLTDLDLTLEDRMN